MGVILSGLNSNINVNLYANPKFSASFMRNIKEALLLGFNLDNIDLSLFNEEQFKYICYGLEDKLDISWYANPEFSDLQMEEIFLGLENNIDVSHYANPEFDWLQMKEIRLGLEQNLDVSTYTNPSIDWQEMEDIRLNIRKKNSN